MRAEIVIKPICPGSLGGALLLVLLLWTGIAAAEAPPCQLTTTGLESMRLVDPTLIEVKARSGFALTVIPTLPKGTVRTVVEGPVSLGLAEAGAFEIRLASSTGPQSVTACHVSFEALWKCGGSTGCTAPLAAISSSAPRAGFAGSVLSPARLAEVLPRHGRGDAEVYNLIVASVVKGGLTPSGAPARVVACDPRDARSVDPAISLQIPLDKQGQPFETADLLLAAPGASRCYRIATLVRDDRSLVIESGDTKLAIPIPQLSAGQPVVLAESSGAQPVCRIESRRDALSVSCDQRIIVPGSADLPKVDIPAPVRYQFRILGEMDGLECPAAPPPQDTPIRAFAPKGRLCIYRKGPAQTGFSRLAPGEELVKRELNGWLFSVCDGRSDSCATATEAGDEIALPLEFSAPPALKIQMDGHAGTAPAIFIATGKALIYPRIMTETKASEIEYFSNGDLDNALLGIGILLCLPLSGSQRTELGVPARFPQDPAPPEYMHIDVGGVSMEVHTSWEVQRDGLHFCPTRVTTPSSSSANEILERFARRELIEVKYSQQGREIAKRRLRSSTSIEPITLSVHDPAALPTAVGDARTDYDPSRSLLNLGKWVCIQLAQDVGNDVQIRLSRIALIRNFGGSVVGRFSSSSGVARFEQHEGIPSSSVGKTYCTNLVSNTSSTGDVRFMAEPGDVPSQGALSFTWDGNPVGCRNAAGDHAGCGGLTPRWVYFAYLSDAARFSHIDVGTARTSDGRTRLRVSGMVPLLDVGVGWPGFISLAPQVGLSLPITLFADAVNTQQSKQDPPPSTTFAGVGLGAFGALCIKGQVTLGPRICGGVQIEGNLDVRQISGRVSGVDFHGLAGYFFSVGVGVR